MSLYVVIPAYNEAENIEAVINAWSKILEITYGGGGYNLLVIDDGSKDNTFKIIQDCAEKNSHIIPLTKKNSGHGPTLLYGYDYALKHGADYIFQTDSDGQTLPEEFISFWELRNEYDAILGKRPDRQDGASRKFIELVLRLILRLIFGVKVPDANCPFRLMKADLLRKYLYRLPRDFNIPNVMLTTYFTYFHENITFKSITFRARQGGKNFINLRKIFKIGIKAVKDFYNFRRDLKNETQN
ncbi:MAG: glycosyltransferase family 2 protein [Synergistaceae bacterium]|nr:glycosyltransferase family 2 protein [Synergistaceae bacterium]